MAVRPFREEDAGPLAALAVDCSRTESDFVLNPLWETERDLFAEFERFGIDPAEHVLVAEAGDGQVVGVSGYLRRPKASLAGLLCPIVERPERGKGLGGELLRATLRHGRETLGIKLAVAGIGTRNRAGYSLLTSQGFRPLRQHFLMRCEAPVRAPGPPSGLTFAAAAADDLPAIHHLYEACGFEARTPAQMQQALADGRHLHAVARRGDELVAFVELETHWTERAWVAFVGVEPRLRARGVGSALVAWSLERAFEAGARSALLVLSPANRTAFRAYEKVGFRRHRTFDVLEHGL